MNIRTRFAYSGVAILTVAYMAASPIAHALNPPPDGGYPNFNTAEGDEALSWLTTGDSNTAIGSQALHNNTSGSSNTATGAGALLGNTTGSSNTADGHLALFYNLDGRDNTAVGDSALFVNDGTGNTAIGFAALLSNATGNSNTAIGTSALHQNTTGSSNTAIGDRALYQNTRSYNTGTGGSALLSNTTGAFNTASGAAALAFNTTGNGNTGVGTGALLFNTVGSSNIALGEFAGYNLDTGDNNIDIGNVGVAGDAATIRMGTQGTQTMTYIAGIAEANALTRGVAVYIDPDTDQLGVTVSSLRFKKDIEPMNDASEAIFSLKPVTFHYKTDKTNTPEFGLIAEEVEKVDPSLVVCDKEGKPFTVRYDAVNAMLLNEFLKAHRELDDQGAKMRKFETIAAQQQATIVREQKEIQALSATVRAQAAQIQKVSAELAASRLTTRLVTNESR